MDNTGQVILKLLKDEGLITAAQAKEILAHEEQQHKRLLKSSPRRAKAASVDISLVEIIDSMGLNIKGHEDRFITEELMMQSIAKHLGMRYFKIDPLKLDSDVVTRGVSKPYAIKHQIVPVELQGNRLTVATANPFDRESMEGIRRYLDYEIEFVISSKTDILKIITEFYGFKSSVAAAQQDLQSDFDLGNLEQYVKLRPITELDSSDHHVVKAVEYLLHYAYSQRASDIHIEPKREHSLVRFRIDGVLHNIHKIPKPVHPAFVSRIKGLARIDIAEKRKPQDGRIKTEQAGKEIELRVSTLPVAFGEKVVVRIFDPDVLMMDLDSLGFMGQELEIFKRLVALPFGLVLVTGPTGSGKTSTLYSTLNRLASTEVNLTTIEDPVEMVHERFNQISVNPQVGITFASALRTILRQDPDIIMVGEIRDRDTAENAIQAALTGHMVFSTLHTNDAPSTIVRMLDLGLQSFLINATLAGVVAQRLLRKVCPHCRKQYRISLDECRVLRLDCDRHAESMISVGMGCAQCRGTGYLGRTGIFEVMEMTDPIKAIVEKTADPLAIRKKAVEGGFRTLMDNALQKLLGGVTTFDEVVRVLGTTPEF